MFSGDVKLEQGSVPFGHSKVSGSTLVTFMNGSPPRLAQNSNPYNPPVARKLSIRIGPCLAIGMSQVRLFVVAKARSTTIWSGVLKLIRQPSERPGQVRAQRGS